MAFSPSFESFVRISCEITSVPSLHRASTHALMHVSLKTKTSEVTKEVSIESHNA